MAYGSRATPARTDDKSTAGSVGQSSGSVQHILDLLATLQVPHSYFQHFYTVSVFSSLFWAVQFLSKGRALKLISQNAPHADPSRSMSIVQIALTWSLMSIQGLRRLLESTMFGKPSASKMWFVHWLLGIAFYLAVGVSVWIEGAGKSGTEVKLRLRIPVD